MTVEEIAARLEAHNPVVAEAPPGRPAAVALLIREGEAGLEILYIIRARADGDPWSGNIGFPGGRIDPGDASARAAAERETREEVGLDLSGARFLGRLDDLVGMNLPVVVSCFVYRVEPNVTVVPTEEVAEALWVPLSCLVDSSLHCTSEVVFGGRNYLKPAITILPAGKPVLWGLTYRLTIQLLQLLGYEEFADEGEL